MIRGRDVITGSFVEVTTDGGLVAAVKQTPAGYGAAGQGGDASELWLMPGLFDIQVNGCRGIDYSGEDLKQDDIGKVVRALARRGITRHIPTIITGSFDRIEANLGVIAEALKGRPVLAAAVPAIHLEGPYISASDGPRGAHDPRHVRNPDLEEFARWQEAAGGAIRMITLAPELPGAPDCIEAWTKQGIIVAIGHTQADPGLVREAVAAGARLSTHLGNGTAAMLPRLDNVIWEQLGNDALYASFICDGYHLPPAYTRCAFRVKPTNRQILVSDMTALAGEPAGRRRWGSIEVEIAGTGRIGLCGTPYLAGAGHDLLHDLGYVTREIGLELSAALPLCTENPSRLFGLESGGCGAAAGELVNIVTFRKALPDGRLLIEAVHFADQIIHPAAGE